MIASIDGATAVADVSGGPADQALFAVLRSQADIVLVAAGIVRAEHYGPLELPVAVISRSCRFGWDLPFFTVVIAQPIVVAVAEAPVLELKKAADLADVIIAGTRRRSGGHARCIGSAGRRPPRRAIRDSFAADGRGDGNTSARCRPCSDCPVAAGVVTQTTTSSRTTGTG